MVYRRKFRKVAKAAKKPYKRRVPRKSNLVKMIRSEIHKQVEDKCAYSTSGNTLYLFNSSVSTSTGDVIKLLPDISNGTLDNQRIGDEIRAKRCQIKGALVMGLLNDLNVTTSRRIAVRMMIVQPKRYNSASDIQSNYLAWTAALLKKGGTQASFTGLLSDLWAPINTDEITKYYDKTVYMQQSPIFTTGTPANAALGSPDIHNTVKFFNINLKMRNKKLRYDPNSDSGLAPTTYNPVMLIGYVHLDGSAADVVNTQVGLTFDTNFYFEDA